MVGGVIDDVGHAGRVHNISLVVQVASIVKGVHNGVLVATGRIQVLANHERRRDGANIVLNLLHKVARSVIRHATKLRGSAVAIDHIYPGLRIVSIARSSVAAVHYRTLRPLEVVPLADLVSEIECRVAGQAHSRQTRGR